MRFEGSLEIYYLCGETWMKSGETIKWDTLDKDKQCTERISLGIQYHVIDIRIVRL